MEKIVIGLLKKILPHFSDSLRQMLMNFLDDLQEQAEKTDNPYDDIAVLLLRALLKIGD